MTPSHQRGHRALEAAAFKGAAEERLHRRVVEEDAPHHGHVPDVMTAPDVVEPAVEPALGDLAGVDQRPRQVDEDGIEDGGVERPGPREPPDPNQLSSGRQSGHGESDIKGHAEPAYVGPIEDRMPSESHGADAQARRHRDIAEALDRIAVKGCILGRDDGGGDEQRDARVVDAGEMLHDTLFRDTAHRMPHTRADEAFARGKEEDGHEKDIPFARSCKVGRHGIEVKGKGQNHQDPDGMRPNVDRFVAQVKDRLDAVDFVLREAVASGDVRIDAPRIWKILVRDEPVFFGSLEGMFDVLHQRLVRPFRFLQSSVHSNPSLVDTVSRHPPSLIDDVGNAAISDRSRSSFQIQQDIFHQAHTCLGLGIQRSHQWD